VKSNAPLLRRLLHDLPPLDPISGEGEQAALPLTDHEAWLGLRGRLATPKPKGSRLIWVLGPAAISLVLTLAVLLLRPPVVSAPAPTTSVSTTVAASNETPSVDALKPRALASGSQIVSSDSSIRVGLPEGSSALLEPHGALALVDLDPEHVVVRLLSGAVYLTATPKRLGDLRVFAGDYAVIVHGTGFRVQRAGDRLRVQLRHGSIEVRSMADGDTQPGRFLVPGEELLLDVSKPEPLRRATLEAVSRGEMDLLAAEEGDTLTMKAATEPGNTRPHRSSAHPARGSGAAAGPAEPQVSHPEVSYVPSLQADIARCRSLYPDPDLGDLGSPDDPVGPVETGATLRLDLTVSETGQVLAAAAERSSVDPRLSGCLAEAALGWRLDAPPEALRGLQFVFPIKL
jgi:FecR protein